MSSRWVLGLRFLMRDFYPTIKLSRGEVHPQILKISSQIWTRGGLCIFWRKNAGKFAEEWPLLAMYFETAAQVSWSKKLTLNPALFDSGRLPCIVYWGRYQLRTFWSAPRGTLCLREVWIGGFITGSWGKLRSVVSLFDQILVGGARNANWKQH